jgi:peptide/nickel transport system substrate-binding protein
MPHHRALNRYLGPAFLFMMMLVLSACRFSSATVGTPTPTLAGTDVPTATSIPAPRTLTVCLGEEPNTLYLYGNPNAAARSVLQAIYDGPVDRADFEYEPVILQKLPRLADGDARVVPVDVKKGDEVVNTDGNLVPLDEGITVYPSGCRSADCAVTYDGSSSLKMDQLVATFTLVEGLRWSDDTPITADDSVFSFEIAGDSATPGSKDLIDRTQSYEAVDELSTEWWGRPGYLDPSYATNFWAPLPKHVLEQFSASQLLEAEESARRPVGWGPYFLNEWVSGDHITLDRNPIYFRSSEGLPKFSTLMFRFIASADQAVSALTSGQCDVLDPSIHLDGQAGLLLEMSKANQLQALFSGSTVMEQLVFGVRPASYDDGSSSGSSERPDILGDKRTRQAIAMCLDRQKVVDLVLFGLSKVPNSYLPDEHPLYADVKIYQHDVVAGTQLLDEVGWKDSDNDPTTPRVAQNITGVTAGTPLVLNYFTTSAVQRRQVAEILIQSLAECGIRVNVSFYAPTDFYAEGPLGIIFGRQFDLAAFAIGTLGVDTPCDWYTSKQIPSASNNWLGVNVSGYDSPAFDAACQMTAGTLPDDAAYIQAYRQAQTIFVDDLPAIPLYWRVKAAAARSDFCGFKLDPSSGNDLVNIEAFDYGEGCK